MMHHSNAPQRLLLVIPYSILQGEDYTLTSGRYPRRQLLAAKSRPLHHDPWRDQTLAEYNRLSRESSAGGR